MTTFDGLVCMAILLFVCLGFFRGLLRSLNGLLGIGIASVATAWVLPRVYVFFPDKLQHTVWGLIVTACVLFFLCLMSCFVVSDWLIGVIRKVPPLRLLDNVFGMLFGALKGAVFVCLVFFGITFVIADFPLQPGVVDARTRPFVEEAIFFVRDQGRTWLAESDFMVFLQNKLIFLEQASLKQNHRRDAMLYNEQIALKPKSEELSFS